MKKNKDFTHGLQYINIFIVHFLMFHCKKHVTNLLFDKMIQNFSSSPCTHGQPQALHMGKR